MARRQFVNPPPTKMPKEAPKDAVKIEFARRLQAFMHQKGFANQSELARAAQKHMPAGQQFGRDSMSHYIRGKILPLPAKLNALCMALGVTKEELVPAKGFRTAGDDNPPLDVRDLQDGNAWLRINRAVRWTVAVKILQLLEGEDRGDGNDSGEKVRKPDGDGNPGSHLAVPA